MARRDRAAEPAAPTEKPTNEDVARSSSTDDAAAAAAERADWKVKARATYLAEHHADALAQAKALVPAPKAPTPSSYHSWLAEVVQVANHQIAKAAEDAENAWLEEVTAREDEAVAKLKDALTNPAPSGSTKGRKATGKHVQPKFEYPEPDTEDELRAIKERLDKLTDVAKTVAELGLEGADVQVLVSGLHEISGSAEGLARRIGMHAVADGDMTQRDLSRHLGVHELTVHRWVKDARKQPQEQPQASGQ